MTVVTHPPYFSLFPRLKMKLKSHNFDTIEVIEAESQAVLSTAVGIRHYDHVALSVRKKLVITSPTTGLSLSRYSSLADSDHGVFFLCS
jgi:hypothetical protein